MDDAARLNDTIVEFSEDRESSSIYLTIRNLNDAYCDNANRWSASFTATLAIAVLASMVITRCSSSTAAYVLFLGAFVTVSTFYVSANICTERADVAILVPRFVDFMYVHGNLS